MNPPTPPTVEECERVAQQYAGQTLDMQDKRGDRHRVRVVGWLDNASVSREPRVLIVPELKPDGPSFLWTPTNGLAGAIYVVYPWPTLVVAVWPCYLETRSGNDTGPDLKRFPHDCPRCGSPAYRGFNVVECSRAGCG